jgi:hypothetical protein
MSRDCRGAFKMRPHFAYPPTLAPADYVAQ